MAKALTVRTIAVLAMPGVQLLDVSGPLDVFAEANVQAGFEAYQLMTLAIEPGPIVSSSGARLMPDAVIGESAIKIDTLLVAGAPGIAERRLSPRLVAEVARLAAKVRRCGSVCTGAFVLAATGLLDGRRVTTHWAAARQFAEMFPAVHVDEDAIHVRDGRFWTAAGVTAGLDLALALVEADLGREIARLVASQLVMFFRRSGGQMQFSRKKQADLVGRSALQGVQRWAANNPAGDLSVPALARRMGITPRHFARLFRGEIGITPAAWVESVRIEAARRLLEEGDEPPKQVAAHCGFADADTLRRAFQRQIGVTPAEYRKHHGRMAPD
jgi:transcriptional regulator GlxA family with amidase domain